MKTPFPTAISAVKAMLCRRGSPPGPRLRRAVTTCLVTGVLACSLLGAAAAQQIADPRGAVVEEIRNDTPSFMVRVSVDRADATYQDGDSMVVTMRTTRKGYAYLFYASADRAVSCLFPNKFHTNNEIDANRDVIVPGPETNYRIRIGKPFGKEVLKLVVTARPLTQLAMQTLINAIAAPLDMRTLRGAYVTDLKPAPKEWAEHYVSITTVKAGAPAARPRVARVGVFIGIDRYADPNITRMNACVADAEAMATSMKRQGKLDEAIVLQNSQATRDAIETVIRRKLPEITKPNDEVFIYWSGHGGRCADDNGDEKDGLDEYLVPHDGRTGEITDVRSTMLLDDAFGRWLQNLDGRRVAVILDTCHSGGQAANEKGLPSPDMPQIELLDAMDSEANRVKDIGQKDTAMLASSRAAELSYIRKAGDLSVMTYFLVEHLNGQRRVTLADCFNQIQISVPKYVADNFPNGMQTPELLGDAAERIILKP